LVTNWANFEVYPKPFLRAFATLRILKLDRDLVEMIFFRPENFIHCGRFCCEERYIGAFSSFKQILWQNRAVLSVTGGAAAVMWVPCWHILRDQGCHLSEKITNY